MPPATRTSRIAATAFLSALLSVASGVLAVAIESDAFLLGVVFFAVLAVVLGICGLIQISRVPEPPRGKGLACWGIGLPAGGVALGFLLLPAN
jgi:hypothetical protein